MIGEINICGQIGSDYDEQGNLIKKGVELIDVVEQIAMLGNVEQYNVNINSQGGYVSVGRDIASLIKSLPNCYTIALEQCASIATEIHLAVALPFRQIVAGTDYFIHNPYAPNVTGDASELLQASKDVKKLEDEMISTYAKATGVSKEALSGLMKLETSLSSEQCIKLNFASKIIEKQQSRAMALFYKQKKNKMSKPTFAERIALAYNAAKDALATTSREEKAMNITTDKGVIVTPYNDLVVGDEVLLEDGTPAPDDTYTAENGDVLVVVGGVIDSITLAADVQAVDQANHVEEIETLKAEIVALKSELATANEAAEVVVAKMEELAKVGSSYTPQARAQQFRQVETPKTLTYAERKAQINGEKK